MDRPAQYDRQLFLDIGRFGRLDSSAYLENIFNARYETGSISRYQVFPGAPVNFRIMAGITF